MSLKNSEKYDISSDKRAIDALNVILRNKSTAEIFIGKYGLVIREIKRNTTYSSLQREKRLVAVYSFRE